jgi:transposase-like protein
MNNNKLEPQLDLNKNQVLKLIETYLLKNDPNELFQHMLNTLMQSERSAFLEENPNPNNKGNGYRPVKKLGMHSKLKLLIPRDRLNLFKPLIIGILNDQDEKMRELTYQLYGKGLTTRQIGNVLDHVYGQHYSKSTISRINEKFHHNIEKWLNRKLDRTYPMMMIDALHVKVKRDTVATEAFYIVLGLKKDFTREILAVLNFPMESAAGWEEVLTKLKERGVEKVGLFVSDDLKGLDASINKVFPESDHQKCTLHLKRNLANKLRKNYRASFLNTLSDVFNPEAPYTSVKSAVEQFKRVLKAQSDLYPSLCSTLARDDLELYFTYLKYDKSIRRMIYTTNWIERFNKSVRRTTKIRDSLPSPHSALMLIGYVAMETETQTYNYPITKFANDEKMNELANC